MTSGFSELVRHRGPDMPLQRTRSRALLGRSPLNGGSLDGGESGV
jgi:hypothetical protein